MRSIYKILAALVIISTAGCKKELHKTPIGIITEGIPPTHASIVYSVTSSYQLLSSTLNHAATVLLSTPVSMASRGR